MYELCITEGTLKRRMATTVHNVNYRQSKCQLTGFPYRRKATVQHTATKPGQKGYAAWLH